MLHTYTTKNSKGSQRNSRLGCTRHKELASRTPIYGQENGGTLASGAGIDDTTWCQVKKRGANQCKESHFYFKRKRKQKQKRNGEEGSPSALRVHRFEKVPKVQWIDKIQRRNEAQENNERKRSSPRSEERKKEWRRAKQMTTKMNAHENTAFSATRFHILEGDVVAPPPPFLMHLFNLGMKYVPHQHPRPFIHRSLPQIKNESQELERVLIWSASFQKLKQEGKYQDDELRTKLPYKRLIGTRGVHPSNRVEEELGSQVHTIRDAVGSIKQRVFKGLERIAANLPYMQKGLNVRHSVISGYLQDHAIVHGDKDGSAVVMNKSTYLHECECNMRSCINGRAVYRVVGGVEHIEHWEAYGKKIQDTLCKIIFGNTPRALGDVLTRVFDVEQTPRLPTCYLLCKTHKSTALKPDKRWASRPVVGMPRWGTTSTSTLMSIFGNILLKLDQAQSADYTPLKDTPTLITRLNTWCKSVRHRGKVLACTSFDFSAL